VNDDREKARRIGRGRLADAIRFRNIQGRSNVPAAPQALRRPGPVSWTRRIPDAGGAAIDGEDLRTTARKNLSDEFHPQAVDLDESTPGTTLRAVAEDLGIVRGTLVSGSVGTGRARRPLRTGLDH